MHECFHEASTAQQNGFCHIGTTFSISIIYNLLSSCAASRTPCPAPSPGEVEKEYPNCPSNSPTGALAPLTPQ